MAEPIAWAVLCTSGKLHGWADTAERAEFSRGLCDLYISILNPCGPHRVAPAYLLTDEEAAALRDLGMRRDADLVRQDRDGE